MNEEEWPYTTRTVLCAGTELDAYRDELRALVTENGVFEAKGELLAILATIHNRDLLNKGGKVLDLLNGLLIVLRDNEGK